MQHDFYDKQDDKYMDNNWNEVTMKTHKEQGCKGSVMDYNTKHDVHIGWSKCSAFDFLDHFRKNLYYYNEWCMAEIEIPSFCKQ